MEEILQQLRQYIDSNDILNAIKLLEGLLPADQADLVEELKKEDQVAILTQLEPSETADVLEEMEDNIAVAVAELLTPEQLAGILDEMENDEAADVLAELPKEQISQTLREMDEPEEIVDLMRHPPDSAGGIMTSLVISIYPEWSVRKVLAELRRIGPRSDSSYYLYITDENSVLIGVVGLRDLVSAPENTLIAEIMETNIVSVLVSTDQEECARVLAKYSYLALPVTDELGRLLGVITADDLVEVAEDEATEDMYRLVGITGDEHVLGPAHISIAKRLPWLAINLLTLFVAISVIDAFETVIAGFVLLAVFLPIVSGEGGNAGSQTATVIVRGLALGDLEDKDTRRALIKEIIVGLTNGVIIGLGTALIAFIWKDDRIIALAIFLAMILNFLMAALTGVIVPLALKRMNIDPALASAAFVTAFTDTFGFLFFLGIVSLMI